MTIHPDNEVDLLLQTEAKQFIDQMKAEPTSNREVKKFIELEKKKYKKTDKLNDMINRY